MIDVKYIAETKNLIVETDEDTRVLISDEDGSFFSYPLSDSSRYDGFFWHNHSEDLMYKIIDHFELPEVPQAGSISFYENGAVIDFSVLNQTVFMPKESRALFVRFNIFHSVKPFFDVRKIFDVREWGRIYNVEINKGIAVIHFKKQTDNREDGSHGVKEFDLYTAIAFSGSAKQTSEWKKVNYPLDESRGSHPFSRYVFCPLEILTDKFVIVPSLSKDYAISKAKKLFAKFVKFQKGLSKLSTKPLDSEYLDFAYALANRNMNLLHVDALKIYAGIPWFLREWARDEAISLYWLLKKDKKQGFDLALKLLRNMINGKVKAKLDEPEGTFSLDAFPFMFKHVFELYLSEYEQNPRKLKALLKKKHFKEFIRLSKKELDSLIRYHFREGMLYAHPGETWMDSSYDIDDREGFNIELQAMMIYLLSKMHWLTADDLYEKTAKSLIEKVRTSFWNGSYLVDNLKNPWLRPNIFLAYYFAPELLSEHQWRICFDNALEWLWLEWGGFSTINRSSKLFFQECTGEDARSYHRGDSWYFINNIAAKVLADFDRVRYGKYIAKILSASTFDILFGHALGCASELSDAKQQKSNGAFAQAFSASTFIELVDFLFKLESKNLASQK